MGGEDNDNDRVGLEGGIKEKLIRSKQRWAEQGRLLTGRSDAKHTAACECSYETARWDATGVQIRVITLKRVVAPLAGIAIVASEP